MPLQERQLLPQIVTKGLSARRMSVVVSGSGFTASSMCGRNPHRRTLTACGTVIARSPSGPCVTPQPLAPRPPNGVAGWAVGAIVSLTTTFPAGIRAASSLAVRTSAVKTDADSPNGHRTASDTASSTVSNGVTAQTGANDASRQTAMSGVQSRSTVGAN